MCRPPAFGLIVAALWPYPEEFKSLYEELCSDLASINTDQSFYLYPFQHLHCTVSTLCSFKTGPLAGVGADHSLRAHYISNWRHLIGRVMATLSFNISSDHSSSPSSPAPIHPFSVSIDGLRLEKSAAFLSINDPSGCIARFRDALRQASQSDPDFIASGVDTSPSSFHIPNIIHTTILRFTKQPSPEVAAQLREKFESWSRRWAAVCVNVDRFVLTTELSPYMHITFEQGYVDHFPL
eukprot:TRINITY_DN5454_c0_g1_i4.p1 TRINITY_DN5454_c0_g1~~TRINITY_DN5454_c0_g1_i4.p1  ORF type:complete len:238 (-),score=32.06 TRINITY_DN5454_c0_g1_i4:50-763(-)